VLSDPIISSKTRRRLLARTLLAPEREFHLRELIRATGLAPRTVQMEVNRLVVAGILVERRSGNRRYLRANEGHPFFRPLRELLAKGEGLVGVIRDVLGKDGVDLTFVFGSIAEGSANATSDIDLLVVGDIGLREAVRRLEEAQEQLGREINPVVWTRQEFKRRRATGDHFLTRVLSGARLMVVGDERELESMDGQGVAQTAYDIKKRDTRPAGGRGA
jgi:predicted nucleotidyltransferase